MSDPQEAATPSDPHSAEAPVWRDAWRTFQDPYLGPDTEKFPSPFESFVAGYIAAVRSRDAEVAELRAERDGLLRLREVAHEEITTWKRRCSEETIAWTEATKRADEAGVLANRYIDHMCDEHGMCGHDD